MRVLKISVMLLFTALLAFCVMCIPVKVNAVGNAMMNIRMPNTAKSGESIKVTVSISNVTEGVSGIQGTLQYDTNVFEYVGNKVLKKGWSITGFNKNSGVFLGEVENIGDNSTYIKGNEDFAEFELKVKDSAPSGNTTVKISNIVLAGTEIAEKEVKADINISGSSQSANIKVNNSTTSVEENKNNNGLTIDKSKDGNSTTMKVNQSTKAMPDTGSNRIVPSIILILMIIIIILYKKCKKYKGI